MRTLLHHAVARKIVAVLAVGSLILPAAVLAKKQQAAQSNSAKTPKGAVKSGSGTSASRKPAKGKSRKSKTKKVRGQAVPTPERISEIQSALARKGAYTGDPTGKWDESTTDAMKKFQAAHGLAPSGKFDALTLQKLGLGSDTAGLGVPTPPPNAAANRLLSPKVQRDEAKNEPE